MVPKSLHLPMTIALLGIVLLTLGRSAAAQSQVNPNAVAPQAIYVDGIAGNDANPGTAGAPYKTIAKANAVVRSGAGDTVYLRSGQVYATALIPVGFAKDNVTYLAWNQPGDAPLRLPPVIDTPASITAFTLQARHDITIDGFFFRDPGEKWGVIKNSYNIRLLNNFFDQAPNQVAPNFVYSGLDITESSHHILLRNNRFNRWGIPRGANGEPGNGDMVWVFGLPQNRAAPSAQNPGAHHVLIDANFFDGFNPANPKNAGAWGNGASAGHALLNLEGRWNVVRNNVFFNLSQKNVDSVGYLDRRPFPDTQGVHDATENLFEGNLFKRATATTHPEGGGGLGLSLAGSNYILRFNKFDRNERAGLQIGAWGDDTSDFLVPAIAGNHIYHNTFYRNGYVPAFLNKNNEDAINMFDYRPQPLQPKNSHNNEFRNNLFYDNAGGISDDGYSVTTGMTQMQFYLRHDDGNFGLNQNFIISNLFYRSTGAANNEILIHAGLSNEPTGWLPNSFKPAFRHHFPADVWNDQDGPLLNNEWLIRANLVADPKLDTNTLALKPGSAAIGAAWALAYTTRAGNNTTTLPVNDARWFSDGFGGLITADALRLGNSPGAPVVQIAAIDYDKQIITLAAPASWPADTQIYLYKISDGTRVLFDSGPDIGAVQSQQNSPATPTATATLPAPLTPTTTPTPTPPPTTGANLIRNGDFSQGEAGWSIGGVGMSYGFEQGQLCLTFAPPPTDPTAARVDQKGLLLENGKRYRVSVTVRSQSAATIRLIVGESQPSWQNYWSQPLDLLAGQTQRYSGEFTMTTTDTNAGLFFHLGGHSSPKICLDEITLQPLVNAGTPTATPISTPVATPTPTSAPVTTGQIRGLISDENSTPLAAIRVYAYRFQSGSWRQVKRVESNSSGAYLLADLPPGRYRLRFSDRRGRYREEFFNDAASLKAATDLTLPSGVTLAGVDAVLSAARGSSAELRGTVAHWVDSATGRLLISAWSGSTFSLFYPASCGDTSAQVQAVLLTIGAQHFVMTPDAATGRYRADLRVPADLADGNDYPVAVQWQCSDGGRQGNSRHDTEIGAFSANTTGPGGQIFSAFTGQPLPNALVTLYRIPEWRPRTSPDDSTENTCESLASKPAGAPWSQPAPSAIGEWVSPQADDTVAAQISPTLNPQLTGDDGRFAWSVTTGCWYIEVEAEGHAPTRSPVIGVVGDGVALSDLVTTVAPAVQLWLPVIIR